MAIAFQHLVRMSNGRTEIAGRGVRVYTILGLHEAGDSPKQIADAYSLPLGAVYEALAYATDHPEEMESIRQNEAAIEREILSRLPIELRYGVDLP